MSEGVGKRIVDALKMQSELEIVDKTEVAAENFAQLEEVTSNSDTDDMVVENTETAEEYTTPVNTQPQPQFQSAGYASPNSMNSNFNSVNFVSQTVASPEFLNNQEVPQNVAILKQLISQLPSGVSRQAGALVIKQTMEALGISMKTVLQEAQQLQESLNLSARECQSSILECKKQINNLELQVQQYQKQAGALNEIISLFVQVN